MATQYPVPEEAAYRFTEEHERGYKAPGRLADPNAAMNGINQSTYDKWRTDHGFATQDVKLVSLLEQAAIYKQYYVDGECVEIERYSGALAICVFDAEFNGGGMVLLQRTVGVEQDGKFGPVTLNALLAALHASGEDACISAYLQNRLDRFRTLHNWADPETRGIWIKRLNDLALYLGSSWRVS